MSNILYYALPQQQQQKPAIDEGGQLVLLIRQHLDIVKTRLERHQDINADIILIQPTYSTLSVIGNRLTHLELISQSLIGVAGHRNTIQYVVLNEIENLISYTQYIASSNDWPASTSQLPRLRHMILLDATHYRYDRDDILTVLNDEHCPELVELKTITKESSNGPFLLVEEGDDEDDEDLNVSTIPADKEAGLGLYRLVIHNIHSARALRSRLEKSSNLLHTMSLTLGPIIKNYTAAAIDWEPLSAFTMHKLSTFHISKDCLPFYEHLPAILRCFPALKSLYLEKATIEDPQPTDDFIRLHSFSKQALKIGTAFYGCTG
ncbi:hypothetical protein BDB00DRAFT_871243 [Zychaea mexicana]|uniref:uncharacterized protein n=1 Tax=Zychaea mexicana TaxID=64656 RepID=UPI0022FEFFC0|nr:uncharacterized protein BDB00DRAFT_871243 [Zychaea mexicana]KAI9494696.1 hypothetical protein BDB00DRAFT_871243 [Zychaea mexicana]